jgi:amino acid transporter
MVLIFGGFTAFCEHSQVNHLFPNANKALVGTFDTSTFITTYFPIPFFIVLFVGYKLVKKSKLRNLLELDFRTGNSAILGIEPPKKNMIARIADKI